MTRAPLALAFVLVAAAAPGAQDAQDAQLAQNLKRLSIEELTQLDVTTVSRRVEPLAQAAAAVTIIRGEDIRRSGVANLPEALRLADAMAVARADNETWAISTRGFNIPTANKMLVLIDGRTIYSPLFGGTFWSVQDVPLADIDRIEVIRGPGGALWGANAVNGIIDIITKKSTDTQGIQVVVAAGTEERATATAQYGGKTAAFDYRVYGKFRARDGLVFANGTDVDDGVRYGQGGIRLDSNGKGRDAWLLQADAYAGREGLFDRPDTHVDGGNVMLRWSRRFSPNARFQIQTYADHVYRRVYGQVRDLRNTFDVESQQQVIVGRHDLLFGGDLLVAHEDDTGNAAFHFDPESRVWTVGGAFAQDDIAIVRERLTAIVGSKFERNTFTGLETQPSARLRWTPSKHDTVWGAVSRAVRLPTRFDTDLRFTNPTTGTVTLSGSPQFDTEKVTAYEAGYRSELSAWASVDVSAYRNVYDDLRSEELPTRAGDPVRLGNLMNARTWGTDLGATLAPVPHWRLHASYSNLHERFAFDPASTDPTHGFNEYNDPAHLASLRSSVDLPGGFEADGLVRAVGRLPHPVVPAYAELDARVGWRVSPRLDVSFVGQNLLHAHHPEFQLASPTREEFQRGAFVRAQWGF